jgi:hypothetical protein
MKGGIMKYLLFFFLLIAFLITAGCISEPKTPTTTISDSVVVPTEPITYQTIVPPTFVPQPIVIKSNGKSGWVRYTDHNNRFSIYKPSNWRVVEVDRSEIPRNLREELDMSLVTSVYIFTPNEKGRIRIYDMDTSHTVSSIYARPGKTQISDESKTQISDELYDGFVNEAYSLITATKERTVNSMMKDSNDYLINGNPARHAEFNSTVNREFESADYYIISHENAYYSEWYFATPGSTQSDALTASDIMHSFTTTT